MAYISVIVLEEYSYVYIKSLGIVSRDFDFLFSFTTIHFAPLICYSIFDTYDFFIIIYDLFFPVWLGRFARLGNSGIQELVLYGCMSHASKFQQMIPTFSIPTVHIFKSQHMPCHTKNLSTHLSNHLCHQ